MLDQNIFWAQEVLGPNKFKTNKFFFAQINFCTKNYYGTKKNFALKNFQTNSAQKCLVQNCFWLVKFLGQKNLAPQKLQKSDALKKYTINKIS